MTLTGQTNLRRVNNMSYANRNDYEPQNVGQASAFSHVRHVDQSSRTNDVNTNADEQWVHDVTIKIKEYSSLEEGWDSYGAPPISVGAISGAAAMVQQLHGLPRPFIAPTSEGGVTFEWHRTGTNFAIEILDVDEIEVTYHLLSGDSWSGALTDLPIDASQVADLMFSDPSR